MKKLGIYTQSEKYSKKLSEYLSEKIEHEFYIEVYFSQEALYDAIEMKTINTLITEEDTYESVLKYTKGRIERIICLSEERGKIIEGCTTIYKYESASEFLGKIVSFNKEKYINDKSLSNLIFIYSPIGGIGTTSFSLSLAKKRSNNRKVLFISLKSFSPLNEMLFLDDRFTINEAIYEFITEDANEFDYKKYIQNAEGFHIIAPSRSYIEITSISLACWISFIQYIQKEGSYEDIIIVMAEEINFFIKIFNIGDSILILKRDGYINKRKLEMLENELMNELSERIYEEKVRVIDIPYLEKQDDVYDGIDSTEIGRRVNIEQIEV